MRTEEMVREERWEQRSGMARDIIQLTTPRMNIRTIPYY